MDQGVTKALGLLRTAAIITVCCVLPVAAHAQITNISPGSNLLAPGSTSVSLTFNTATSTTCGYSVGASQPFSSMTLFDTGGATTSHQGVIQGLSASPAVLNQVFLACASDPTQIQNLQYRSVAKPSVSFPHIGSIWVGNDIYSSNPAQASKIQLYLGPGFPDPSIPINIRAQNPNVLILDARSADEQPPPSIYAGIIPDSYYLKDIHGNRIQDWPGLYVMNLTNPAVGEFLAQVDFQDLVNSGFAYDGIFFDNFTEAGISWMTTDYAGNPIQIDANGDGVPDDPATLDAAWTAGIDHEIATFRKLMPYGYAAAHMGAGTSTSYTAFNGVALNFYAPEIREGLESFGTLSGLYQSWQAQGRAPQITMVQSAPALQISYGYGYNPGAAVLPSLLEFARTSYPSMRFGLATSLMGNGFSTYDFGDAAAPVTWWYDEYDFNLGQPLGAAQLVGRGQQPPNLLSNGSFETGLSSWQLAVYGTDQPQASAAIDTTTAVVGSASALVDVTAASAISSEVTFQQQNLPLQSGINYTVSFWAKADAARTIELLMQGGAPNYPDYSATQNFAIDTGWQQYSFTFTAPSTVTDDRLEFWVGDVVGRVWFDGVSMTLSPPQIYRRDFENGVVLLNGMSNSQTISLENGLQRFIGGQAPRYQFIVDDAQAAFSTTGSWQAVNYGPTSTQEVANGPYQHAWGPTLQSSTVASATATWVLGVPADDQYTLQVWLAAAPDTATWTKNAVYEVMVNGSVIASASLDQTTASAGDTWHPIFTNLALTAASNPVLRVRNAGSGKLIADAVYATSASRYNDGSAATSVTLAPFDGILLQRTQPIIVGIPGGVRPGVIFSTAQSSSQSFLRFFNTGNNAGTVTALLSDYASGQLLGQWTSPSIPAGAELQYDIGTVETGTGQTFTKPSYYSLSLDTGITGYFQHVLWRPADGTLTNLSTCAAGVTADPINLSGVHSSLLGTGFPSSIVVTNTGTSAETVKLDFFDARNGNKLGTYTTASIPPNGQVIPSVDSMEAQANFAPTTGMYHYVVKAEAPFTGFLQNLVNNAAVGVITDMTTSCNFSGASVAPTISPLKNGAVFSTEQSTSQSYLRFFNTGTTAGTVTVTLNDYTSGQSLGQWTSPSIPALSEQQFFIGTLETGAGVVSKPSYYSIRVQSGIAGYFQHVLYRPTDGTLTNLSTCASGVAADATKLGGVHSSLLANIGFPSSIVISNTGDSSEVVALDMYDARNGTKLGTYTSPSIPANAQIIPTVSAMETAAGITPTAGMYHYVLEAQSGFIGFLQNLVDNTIVGVTTDMTTACGLVLAVP